MAIRERRVEATRNATDARGTWRETFHRIEVYDVTTDPNTGVVTETAVSSRDGEVFARQMVAESAAFTAEREATRTVAAAEEVKRNAVQTRIDTLGDRCVKFAKDPVANAALKLNEREIHRLLGALCRRREEDV